MHHFEPTIIDRHHSVHFTSLDGSRWVAEVSSGLLSSCILWIQSQLAINRSFLQTSSPSIFLHVNPDSHTIPLFDQIMLFVVSLHMAASEL
jgi:hypothetical protein